MDLWAAAIWGLAGGLCVEGLWLYSQIRKDLTWSWRRPIPQGMVAYLVSVVLRVGAGGGLAAAAAGSGQVSGSFAAFVLGLAAPLVVEKLAGVIPLAGVLTVVDSERTLANEAGTQVGQTVSAELSGGGQGAGGEDAS